MDLGNGNRMEADVNEGGISRGSNIAFNLINN